ncbi:hypothetical protein [Arthrospiribacter ruber]|uniref:Uncharacterized protein n=1 Tax=Arthrospiribacter ruber TaxID=2487934 RepID=A0A951IX54_9BACT|nr:hypothetical protein [Arthrospiribacter ruber]MBW3468800.1 hypothetical protein [Arthrospiribacter ruber]
MKYLSVFFFVLFLLNFQPAEAQSPEPSGLLMYNQKSGKTKFIPENKRVTLTNYRGFRSSGKLKVISKEEVLVHGRRFRVAELSKVRRNYLGTKIIGAVLLVGGQTVIEVEKAVSTGMFDSSVETLRDPQVSAAGFIMMGASLPLLLYAPNYKYDKWTYEAVPSQALEEFQY